MNVALIAATGIPPSVSPTVSTATVPVVPPNVSAVKVSVDK